MPDDTTSEPLIDVTALKAVAEDARVRPSVRIAARTALKEAREALVQAKMAAELGLDQG